MYILFQSKVVVPRCAVPIIVQCIVTIIYTMVPIISASSLEMFENIISIGKTTSSASKNFTSTKNNVLFYTFEATIVFPLSHDIILPEIVVALVQSYCGSLSYRYRCPYVTHLH